MLRKTSLFLLFLLAGAAACALALVVSARILRFDHPILTAFGIRKPEVIGFMPYWLLAKADKEYGRYLTTLTYFGLVVDSDGKPVYLAKPNEEEPGWTALKGNAWETQAKKAAGLKHSLLVHSADEDAIATLLSAPREHAEALVDEVVPIMDKRGFTDLNLDIESFAEASDEARMRFTTFVETVAARAKRAGIKTVTIEIPPIALFRPNIADPVALGRAADRVVIMTYDYHYLGSFMAGPVAPVGGGGTEREFDVEMAVREAVRRIPPEKIILGVPLYGYEWETIAQQPGAATIPGGASTASTRRVAELLAACATCSAQTDSSSREPFVVYADGGHYQQIFYENETSMKEKVALATRYRLGGVAVWALGYEDSSMLGPLSAYRDAVFW